MSKIIVTAGGGGHTGYAIAFIERFLQRSDDVVVVVDPEDKWSVWKIRKRFGPSIKIVYSPRLRSFRESVFKALLRLPKSLYYSLKLPEVRKVVCTGSNQALIPSIKYLFEGVEVICIEAADRIVTRSRTVSILHDLFGAKVLLHWPQQRSLYKRSLVIGPLYPKPLYKPSSGDYILVVTGTAGNPRLVKSLLKLKSNINVVLQVGECCDPNLIRRLRPNWKVFRFTPDIERFVAKARLVITHQGLTAVESRLGYKKDTVIAFNPDLPLTSTLEDVVEFSKILRSDLLIDYSRLREVIKKYL